MIYKTILHATDLKQNHFEVCMKAAKLAKYHHADLYLLHVIEVPSSVLLAQNLGFMQLVEPAKEDAQTVMRTLGEALNLPPEQQLVDIGSVQYHVIEAAKKRGCELIVLGGQADHRIPALLGGTSYQIMQHAPCDVLILR